MTVPKVSRDSAETEDVGVLLDRFGEVEDYSVDFLTFREDVDATPLLKGAPGDQCQCPHWGYVLKGELTYRVGDGEETFEAGDAFYLPPRPHPGREHPQAASPSSSARPRSCGRRRR
jgi:hypothetical protein